MMVDMYEAICKEKITNKSLSKYMNLKRNKNFM